MYHQPISTTEGTDTSGMIDRLESPLHFFGKLFALKLLNSTMFKLLELPNSDNSPVALTYPYHYKAHDWVKLARSHVCAHLEQTASNQAGRLIAVLVCRLSDGQTGYICGCDQFDSHDDFFEPSFWQKLPPEKLTPLDTSRVDQTFSARVKAEEAYLQFKNEALARKAHRRETRQSKSFNPSELAASSQRDSGQLQRLKLQYMLALQAEEAARADFQHRIHHELIDDYKRRLNAIVICNARGARRSLCQLLEGIILKEDLLRAILRTALPVLLAKAYREGARPLCMGCFWWGPLAAHDARAPGTFCAFAKERHETLLQFLLEGQPLEDNALAVDRFKDYRPEIVYEDRDIVAVNKPEGMLSVPGKLPVTDLFTFMQKHYEGRSPILLLHRLDMATSGVVIFAKNKETHRALQQAFSTGAIQKCYIALLSNTPNKSQGAIDLPLCLNPYERPRQMVEFAYGKPALTNFKVLKKYDDGRCRVAFFPLTGRTHQLRLHAAHHLGLGCPIVGDDLYGTPDSRLYLHAQSLTFTHPKTGKVLTIEASCPF